MTKRNNKKPKIKRAAYIDHVVPRIKSTPLDEKPKLTKPEQTEIDKLTNGKRPDVIKFGSRQYIMEVIGLDGLEKIVLKVYTQAIRGSFKHQELLMNYLMGKPVERLKLDAYVEKGMTVPAKTVLQIVADHSRLNKLSRDVVDGGNESVSAERIKEMEDLLNNGGEIIIESNDDTNDE